MHLVHTPFDSGSITDLVLPIGGQKCLRKGVVNTITYKSRLTQIKLYKKNDAIFSIYGRNGIKLWHFFEFSLGSFEVIDSEGGRLVKEADFEAEKKILLKKII